MVEKASDLKWIKEDWIHSPSIRAYLK